MNKNNQFISESTQRVLGEATGEVQGSETFVGVLSTDVGKFFAKHTARFLQDRLSDSSMDVDVDFKQTTTKTWSVVLTPREPTSEFEDRYGEDMKIGIMMDIEGGRIQSSFFIFGSNSADNLEEGAFKPTMQVSKALDRVIHSVAKQIADEFAQLGDTGTI